MGARLASGEKDLENEEYESENEGELKKSNIDGVEKMKVILTMDGKSVDISESVTDQDKEVDADDGRSDSKNESPNCQSIQEMRRKFYVGTFKNWADAPEQFGSSLDNVSFESRSRSKDHSSLETCHEGIEANKLVDNDKNNVIEDVPGVNNINSPKNKDEEISKLEEDATEETKSKKKRKRKARTKKTTEVQITEGIKTETDEQHSNDICVATPIET